MFKWLGVAAALISAGPASAVVVDFENFDIGTQPGFGYLAFPLYHITSFPGTVETDGFNKYIAVDLTNVTKDPVTITFRYHWKQVGQPLGQSYVEKRFFTGIDVFSQGAWKHLNLNFSGYGDFRFGFSVPLEDRILFDNLTYYVERGATVPEPSTWALLLLGFGGIGTALRRATRTAKHRYFA